MNYKQWLTSLACALYIPTPFMELEGDVFLEIAVVVAVVVSYVAFTLWALTWLRRFVMIRDIKMMEEQDVVKVGMGLRPPIYRNCIRRERLRKGRTGTVYNALGAYAPLLTGIHFLGYITYFLLLGMGNAHLAQLIVLFGAAMKYATWYTARRVVALLELTEGIDRTTIHLVENPEELGGN